MKPDFKRIKHGHINVMSYDTIVYVMSATLGKLQIWCSAKCNLNTDSIDINVYHDEYLRSHDSKEEHDLEYFLERNLFFTEWAQELFDAGYKHETVVRS